ncbi:17780_t:CDS:2 [Rhizophagus irregularis]|nr:17780_t:CDS:2 [Rhizophagus irregularis]
MVSNTPLVILAVACIINNIHNWNLLKANTKRQRARFERTKNLKPEDLPYVPQSLYSQNLAKLIILLVVTNGEEPFKLKRKDAESKRKQAAMNVFHQRAKPPRYDKIKSKTVLMNDAMTNIFNVSGLDTSKQIFWRHTCCCLYDDTKEIERRPNKRDVLTSFPLSCYERKIQTKNSTNH